MSATIHLLKSLYISITTGLIVGALVFSPLSLGHEINTLLPVEPPIQAPEALIQIAKGAIVTPEFPDYTQNYQTTIVIPKQEAEAAEKARLAAIEAAQAAYVAPVVQTTYIPIVQGLGTLMGSYGYAIGGNCVNEINPRPMGNPITWQVTTQTPYIGAAALFYYNHVARVVGFWSNGDIEVAQQGWSGPPITRFPRSTFRGFI